MLPSGCAVAVTARTRPHPLHAPHLLPAPRGSLPPEQPGGKSHIVPQKPEEERDSSAHWHSGNGRSTEEGSCAGKWVAKTTEFSTLALLPLLASAFQAVVIIIIKDKWNRIKHIVSHVVRVKYCFVKSTFQLLMCLYWVIKWTIFSGGWSLKLWGSRLKQHVLSLMTIMLFQRDSLHTSSFQTLLTVTYSKEMHFTVCP